MTHADRDALYERFEQEDGQGLKAAAKATLRAFLDTFTTDEDRRAWTSAHLNSLPTNRHGRIRHEVYEEVIFPVLAEGHAAGDPQSTYWLARTMQNLYSAQHLHARIGHADADSLLKTAHAAAPDAPHIREALLTNLLGIFEYIDHEWPGSLLVGLNAGEEEWQHLDREVALARKLDESGRYRERLDEFERRMARDRAEGPRQRDG